MNETQNVLEKESKLVLALTDPIRQVAHIIPYLEQRFMTAKKLNVCRNEDERKHLEAMLEYINKEISKILGL